MSETQSEAGIRAWTADRRVPEVYVARWLELTAPDRIALLDLVQRLPVRTGQFVTIFTLLEEISVRESRSIAEIVARREIRQVFASNQSSPGKARALLDALGLIRLPQLHVTLDRLTVEIAELKLPIGVRIVLPANLSSDEVRVELTAHGSTELQRLVGAVAAKSTELGRIANLLGGADEV